MSGIHQSVLRAGCVNSGRKQAVAQDAAAEPASNSPKEASASRSSSSEWSLNDAVDEECSRMVRDELSVMSAFLAVADERSFTKAAKRLE